MQGFFRLDFRGVVVDCRDFWLVLNGKKAGDRRICHRFESRESWVGRGRPSKKFRLWKRVHLHKMAHKSFRVAFRNQSIAVFGFAQNASVGDLGVAAANRWLWAPSPRCGWQWRHNRSVDDVSTNNGVTEDDVIIVSRKELLKESRKVLLKWYFSEGTSVFVISR